MTMELHELAQNMYRGGFDAIPERFRHVWFSMILSDPATFLAKCSATSKKISKLRGEPSTRSGALLAMSMQSVALRLDDPSKVASDGMIGAILSLVSAAVSFIPSF